MLIDSDKISLAQAIAEIERELRRRSRTYPRLIAERKLRPAEAEFQNACLRKALDILHRERQREAGQ